MNKLCIIGIGGVGATITENVALKYSNDNLVTSIAIDTNKYDIKNLKRTQGIDVSYPNNMGEMLSYLNENGINIFEDYTQLGYILSLPMDKGANAWRLKAFASFVAYMTNVENKERFDSVLDSISVNDNETLSLCIVSSLAGGTGSALSLIVSLYVKNYLKNKGVNRVESAYFAVCPDMFSQTMNLEMKTKSFANAYATLLEINAINNSIINKNNVSIKVGFENEKSFGLLFDGNNNEFLTKEYLPFDKIILLDRMTAVNSIDFHLGLFANYIYNYYLGYTVINTENQIDKTAIFKTYNIVELNYSTTDIINYIAKYQSTNVIKNELLTFYKNVDKYQPEFGFKEDKNVNNYEVDIFAKKITPYFEYANVSNKEKTSHALNREDKYNELTSSVDDTSFIDTYLTNINKDIYSLIKNEAYNEFYQKINSKEKRFNRNDFINKVDELYNEITDLYYTLIDNAVNENLTNLFLSTDTTNSFSFVNYVLKDGENFVHPTIALIRLNELYLLLKSKIDKKYFYKSENLIYDENNKQIPVEFLNVVNCAKGSKGYAKLGEDRFTRIVAKINKVVDVDKLNKKEKKEYLEEVKKYTISYSRYDKKFIYQDFNLVLENLLIEIKYIYLSKLLNLIENLIVSYRKTLNNLSANLYKLQSEVEASKQQNVSNFVYYGIATSPKNKEYELKNYLSTIDSEVAVIQDNILGEEFYNYCEKQLNIEEFETEIENLTNNYINKLLNLIKNSNYYLSLDSKNIFEKIFENKIDITDINNLKLALKIDSNLLLEHQHKIITKKTLFVSPIISKYLLDNKKLFNLKSDNETEILDEFLVTLGEYSAHVVFDNSLSNKKAFVTIEKSEISFNQLSKTNGDKSISLYKNEYEKALLNMKNFESVMWNPNIFNF